MKRNNDNPTSDESFDRLIRDSLHVEVDDHRVARLNRFWFAESRRRLWRRRAVRAAAMAAAIFVAITAVVLLWTRRERVRPELAVRSVEPERAEPHPAAPPVAASAPVTQPSRSSGRDPTAYERLVFASRTSTRQSSAPTASDVDDAVDRLVLNPNEDARQVFDALIQDRGNVERLLLRKLMKSTDDERRAILRLLAIGGSARSTPALLQLAKREAIRDAALDTVVHIVGVEQLAAVVIRADHPSVRRALVLRMLTAESEPGLRGYLSLVRNDTTRFAALAAAESTPQLPITALVRLLDHEEEAVRLSAAMVLGHVNGPDITKMLIARVTQQPADSTEAWMALLACRGELAEEFLAYASHRPQLLGHFNNARVRWVQLVQ